MRTSSFARANIVIVIVYKCVYTLIPNIVVGKNNDWQLSNGDCTTERNGGFHMDKRYDSPSKVVTVWSLHHGSLFPILYSIPKFLFSPATAVRRLTFVVLPDNIFWNRCIFAMTKGARSKRQLLYLSLHRGTWTLTNFFDTKFRCLTSPLMR